MNQTLTQTIHGTDQDEDDHNNIKGVHALLLNNTQAFIDTLNSIKNIEIKNQI
jgi:hypothetical protein